jgi:hypothetical protein
VQDRSVVGRRSAGPSARPPLLDPLLTIELPALLEGLRLRLVEILRQPLEIR